MILRKCIKQTHVQRQKLWSWQPKLKTIKVKLATYRINDKESTLTAMMPLLWNQTCSVEHPTTLKHRGLLVFSNFETAELPTLSTESASDLNSKAKLCRLNTKSLVFRTLSLNFDDFYRKETNARLRGWQRITTKLNHNNCNHRGSLGLETPRVDSPSWGVC